MAFSLPDLKRLMSVKIYKVYDLLQELIILFVDFEDKSS